MTEIPKQETGTELIAVIDINYVGLLDADTGIDALVKMVRDEVDKIPQDMTTAQGRKDIISLGERVRKSRIAIEKQSKEYCDNLKNKIAGVKAGTDKFSKQLNDLIVEIQQPVKDFNNAEDLRKDRLRAAISVIRSMGLVSVTSSLEDVQGKISELTMPDPMDWQEFAAEAQAAKLQALSSLNMALAAIQKSQAMAAELEALKVLTMNTSPRPETGVHVIQATPAQEAAPLSGNGTENAAGAPASYPPQATGAGAVIPAAPTNFGFGVPSSAAESAAKMNFAKEAICEWFRREQVVMNIEAIFTSIFLGEVPYVQLNLDAIKKINLGGKTNA